jgi:hypothetical protein
VVAVDEAGQGGTMTVHVGVHQQTAVALLSELRLTVDVLVVVD